MKRIIIDIEIPDDLFHSFYQHWITETSDEENYEDFKRYCYDHITDSYDRISVVGPKSFDDLIKIAFDETGGIDYNEEKE